MTMSELRGLVAAVVCLVLLAACGGDAAPTPTTAGEASPTAAATATTPPSPTVKPTPAASPVAASYALAARWGSPVALPAAADVAVAPDGTILVGGTAEAEGQITVFEPSGEIRTTWHPEAFTRAIATGPDGRVHVWAKDALLALDQNGGSVETVAVSGLPNGQPPPLIDLTVAPDGMVYLAAGLGPSINTTARVFNGLIALDPSGVELGRWELPDPLRLRQVVALPDGTVAVVLAVAESAGPSRDPDRILRLDPATFTGDWESGAARLDEIRRIDGLAALPDGGLAAFAVGGEDSGNPAKSLLVRREPDGSETGRWTIPNYGGKYFIDTIGMTALPDGTLLVVDGANHRVMRVGADGEVTGEIGGVQPDDFGTPQGIAIGPDGDIYVIDGLLNRVTTFTPGGDSVSQFTLPGHYAAPGEPRDIAVGNDGRIYATRGVPGEVVVMNADGAVIDRWTQPPREIPGGISVFNPARLAINDENVLYVAMYPDRGLDLYTADGELIGTWPFASDALQVLDVTTQGTTAWALVSNGGFRIERLDVPDDTTAVVVVDLPKTGDRPDIVPLSIALDADGNIYLADPFARLIVKLDAQGQEITRWDLGVEKPETRGTALALAVGPDGRVYVADAGTGQVLVYAPE